MEKIMKRFILYVVSLTLAVIMAAFASGCQTATSLAFQNYFLGAGVTGDAPRDTFERLEFNVSFEKESAVYPEFNQSQSLKESQNIQYDFTDGKYAMTFSIASNTEEIKQKTNIEIDTQNTPIYKLQSIFNIKAFYKVDGNYPENLGTDKNGGKEFDDEIISEVYFLPAGSSFAPIYSKVIQKQTTLYLGQKADVYRTEYVFETIYNKGSYKTVTKSIDGIISTKSSNYSYRGAIDNTQLLFAIRNLEIQKDGATAIPTVSPAYNSPQSLTIRCEDELTINSNYNQEDKQISVKKYAIFKSNKLNTGIPQYALVQKSEQNNKSLLMEYASALVPYGSSFLMMGALVYRLASVS